MVDATTYDANVKALNDLCDQIVAEKRPVYTQKSPDVLYNFKLNAQMANSTVGQSIAFGLVKQVLGVVQLLTDPLSVDVEADTRFVDAINYLRLGYVAWANDEAYLKG